LAIRARGYAMANAIVDGNDVIAVYDCAAAAIARARAGGGPTFLECKTYRHRGHSRTDPAKYRDASEVEAWLKRDPLKFYRTALEASGVLGDDEAERIVVEERKLAKAAADRAAASAWASPEQDFMARTYA
jgi:pyruvate dehydrogenase E1 component alpha subunit